MNNHQVRYYRPVIEALEDRQLPGDTLGGLLLHGLFSNNEQPLSCNLLNANVDIGQTPILPSLKISANCTVSNPQRNLNLSSSKLSLISNESEKSILGTVAANQIGKLFSDVTQPRYALASVSKVNHTNDGNVFSSTVFTNNSGNSSTISPPSTGNRSVNTRGDHAPLRSVNEQNELVGYLTAISKYQTKGSKSQPASFMQNVGSVSQDVPINSDNDNGSTVTHTIPALYDFHAGFTPAENDLVVLNAQWVLLNPLPPEIPYTPVISRTWNLGQSGGQTVRLKMWADMQKSSLAATSGTGFFPIIWLEGTEPSETTSDVVNIDAFRWETHKDGYVSHYQLKTVNAIVTPVVTSFSMVGVKPRWVGNAFTADANFTANLYIGNIPSQGEPRYIQVLNNVTNDISVPGYLNYAIEYTDGVKYRFIPASPLPGPNTVFSIFG